MNWIELELKGDKVGVVAVAMVLVSVSYNGLVFWAWHILEGKVVDGHVPMLIGFVTSHCKL